MPELRARYDGISAMFPLPDGITVEAIDAGGVPAERLSNASTVAGRTILYLHGGGYSIGSPASHRHVAAAIVEAAGATLVVPAYRLAPEHRYPSAIHDALAAYNWLLEQGQDPNQLIIAGDSAGGGLALATMVSARNQGIKLPAAAVLISPWVDLAGTGGTLETLQARDPIVQKAGLLDMAGYYLGERDPRTPLASPLYADLTGLPPLLIQVGTDEVLLDDSLRLNHRGARAGRRDHAGGLGRDDPCLAFLPPATPGRPRGDPAGRRICPRAHCRVPGGRRRVTAAAGALARFTVLDLTRVRAGPTAVRQLADWGAKIIKIEPPAGKETGEPMGGPRHGSDFPEPAAQQAQPVARPEAPGWRRHPEAAGGPSRCAGREFPARRQVPPGHRLPVAEAGQSGPGLCQHLRLRPGWALSRPPPVSTRWRRGWAG